MEDTFYSDHFSIEIKFNYIITKRSFFLYKAKFSTAEWKSFTEKIFTTHHLLKLQRPITDDNVLVNYEIFIDYMKSFLSRGSVSDRAASAPSSSLGSSPVKHSSPAPWWSDRCQEVVDLRRGFLREFKRNLSLTNYITFKRQEAISKKVLRREKREGWRSFCSKLGPDIPIDYIYGKL